MTRLHKYRHFKTSRALIVAKRRKPLLVDRLTLLVAVIEPIIVVPQIYQIFRYKDASGLSLPAWMGFEVFCLVWMWYGLVHKDKMIFIYQSLYFVANSLVIAGALMYGGKWF